MPFAVIVIIALVWWYVAFHFGAATGLWVALGTMVLICIILGVRRQSMPKTPPKTAQEKPSQNIRFEGCNGGRYFDVHIEIKHSSSYLTHGFVEYWEAIFRSMPPQGGTANEAAEKLRLELESVIHRYNRETQRPSREDSLSAIVTVKMAKLQKQPALATSKA